MRRGRQTMLPANRESNSERRKGAGFSLIELLIVVAIILVIAAIAIPNLLQARRAANQAAAAENVRTINSAAAAYASTFDLGYPPSFSALGGTTGNPSTCTAAVLIDEVLSTAPHWKSGYAYDYQPEGAAETVQPSPGCVDGYYDYLITAVPLKVGSTGQNSYCADEPGAIHFDPTGNLPASTAACEALPPLQ
jgi:type IV pilus assembly protein PilA